MQAKSSKVKAEWVIGKYNDYPYKKAKKVDKSLIQRRRRSLEKRESQIEINDSLSAI